jgi:hypothetical protein
MDDFALVAAAVPTESPIDSSVDPRVGGAFEPTRRMDGRVNRLGGPVNVKFEVLRGGIPPSTRGVKLKKGGPRFGAGHFEPKH